MKAEARVNEHGQIELPKEIREKLALEEHLTFDVELEGKVLTLRPKKDMDAILLALDELAGSFRESFVARGFTSTDDYMKLMRGDDYRSR